VTAIAGRDAVARPLGTSLWWGLVLILAWFGFSAWARPLMLPDEGRYVGVAWEMLRSGDWLVPRLDGLPFFHKPPLFYWITAASLGLFGPHEWAARLAPLLGATAAAASLLWLSLRWSTLATSRLAGGVLLSLPLFFVGAQFANLDMLVAGCISVCVVALAHSVLMFERGTDSRAALSVAWLAAGLGILAKGLIGGVLPALVVLAWLVASGRLRFIGRLMWWPAMALFVLVTAPWFVAMQLRFPGFFDYFFVVQHFHRFAQGGFNNVQPWWFYPAVLAVLGLPWTGWAVAAVRAAWQGRLAPQPLRSLMLCWMAVVVVFFSLPQSKLIGYVLSAVPPMAWLLADGMGPIGRRWARWCAVLALALALGAVTALAVSGRHSARPIGLALAAAATAETPVIFAGDYLYDVPFYARTAAPVWVVDDWHSPDVATRDNWRKELADAAAFAPEADRERLITPAQLPARLCAQAGAWLVLPLADAGRFPVLAGRAPQVQADGHGLWRIDRQESVSAKTLACPGTPNAD